MNCNNFVDNTIRKCFQCGKKNVCCTQYIGDMLCLDCLEKIKEIEDINIEEDYQLPGWTWGLKYNFLLDYKL